MNNSLFRVTSKGLPGAKAPLSSDVNQFVDLLNGLLDVGAITLAPPIAVPTITGVTAAASAGTWLGIGAYRYELTYVTGNLQADNTYTISGETPGSASFAVMTTSGNQVVAISGLPAIGTWPATAIGLRIYRTAVGGADGTQKLVTTIWTNYARTSSQTSYTDTTADASLGAAIPTTNTTGTSFSGTVAITGNQSIFKNGALEINTDTRSTTLSYDGSGTLTTVTEKDGATTVRTTTLNYDVNGNLTSSVEVAGGVTVTTTLNYTTGNLTSTTKAVT